MISNQFLNRSNSNSKFQKKGPATNADYSFIPQKSHFSKTLAWNIEEYNENKEEKKDFFSAAKSLWPGNQLTVPTNASVGGWEKSLKDLKKMNYSKSQKTLKLASDYEEQNKKQLHPWTPSLSSQFMNSRQNLKDKDLTYSAGFKSTLADLTASSHHKMEGALQVNSRDNRDQVRRLKPSKSERRIINDSSEQLHSALPKQDYIKDQYISSEFATKNIKRDTKFDQRYAKFKQRQVSPLRSPNLTYNYEYPKIPTSKSSKKVQDLSPSKVRKNSNHHQQIQVKNEIEKQSGHRISLSDFALGKCKGQGAFGQVFVALHRPTHMIVAIKKIPKQKVRYMLQQFIGEIKIQMFLNHSNIVKLYGFFDDTTHFYIIMEYMEGGSLFAILKKNKRLSEKETAERLKQVCLGLQEMHKNSILHRDIKPQNVVLTNDVCKLCDFGWAAVCKDRRTTYCGTFDYLSPEIIEEKGYDDSVDIWCIGVLAYQMICGKTPFYNISRQQTMKRIANASYQYPPQISGCAKAFIDRILKRDPSERIDIQEVLKDKFFG